MPYIEDGARQDLDKRISLPSSAGELNYTFTMIIKRYIEMKSETYQTYNDIIGALECCKLELYRRRISGYEDQKRWKNGDVWEEEAREAALDSWGGVIEK